LEEKALDCHGGMVSLLTNSDVMDAPLTREAYDMIDRDKLVVKA
jgi:hypothetical protein